MLPDGASDELGKRFNIPKGTLSARAAKEKWSSERVEGQTLHDNKITFSDDPRLAQIQATVHDCKLAALEAEARTAKALALKAAKAVETLEIDRSRTSLRLKPTGPTCGRQSRPQSSRPSKPHSAGNDWFFRGNQEIRRTTQITHVKLTDHQRSHLDEILRDRPQWFKDRILADIAAEERQEDEEDTPRSGLSAYTLACLESELGIM